MLSRTLSLERYLVIPEAWSLRDVADQLGLAVDAKEGMTAVQLAQTHLHLHLTLAGVQAATCPDRFV